jgi:hypothetical protein
MQSFINNGTRSCFFTINHANMNQCFLLIVFAYHLSSRYKLNLSEQLYVLAAL